MKTIVIDIETYSDVSLADCGVYKYAESPNFDILLIGYAYDDEPVHVIDLTAGDLIPMELFNDLYDPAVLKVAHNANFELTCLSQYLPDPMNAEQWLDTAVMAAACGLPRNLDGACKALGFTEDTAKDARGKALIKLFSCPHTPTKTNPEIRVSPERYPDKWATYIAYNRQDVVAERELYRRLKAHTPDAVEHDFWVLDQKINSSGIKFDRDLAEAAIELDAENKRRLTEEAVKLTGLENPNSVSQIKQWLYDQEGVEVVSLNKKVIAGVAEALQQDSSKEFLAIRSELSKSSTKKYEAMIRSGNTDDHIRGCFLFYGAARTGRFAGRLVQLQNLKANSMEGLATARDAVRTRDYDFMQMMYGSVSTPLSELVRTALIPEEGHQFVVADFSAIEARVIAWLAQEEWRLQAFRAGEDIYCQSASQMFHVPVKKNGVNGHLRKKGKVAELACIAEGSLVLTDQGLVPIEAVTTDMKLWDGEEWVEHDGVIYKGKREVITYEGLTATTDHLVWVEGQSRPIHFRVASACGSHLIQTGDGGQAIRMGEGHIPGEAVERKAEPLLRSDEVYGMRLSSVADAGQPAAGNIQGMPELLSAETDTTLARPALNRGETAMRESVGQGVQELRSSWDKVRVPERNDRRSLHDKGTRPTGTKHGARPNRHQRRLRSRKSAVCGPSDQPCESEKKRSLGVLTRVLALCSVRSNTETLTGDDAGRNHRGCRAGRTGTTEELARNSRTARVYDIQNAGPRHRFTVSGKLVHNCGYGGSVGAMLNMGAADAGMTEEEMANVVAMWRQASPNICSLWRELEREAQRCVVKRMPTLCERSSTVFTFEDGTLWMWLPSGRKIAYYGATYEESAKHPGKKSLLYMAQNQTSRKWEKTETWGGKLVENLVQATARDCLRDAMLGLDKAGWDIRAHVHDEVICTEPRDGRGVDEMVRIMTTVPKWAEGLPLNADGYVCDYYFKD